ncbi:hypothetical protein [Mammaliicoccus vitulinus]|uniref:hypothetical protein n=1 Tax=Mammaliicoccus vitulinus TaxID=71237 RepID=UPI00248C2D4A|nr:hypothetical protein [Mammaliicoccus vitulinus]
MANVRKVKQLDAVNKKLSALYNTIDFEELNYGDIKVDNNSNFILEKENEVNEILTKLDEFKKSLLSYKDKYRSQKTTDKIMEILKNDSANAELLKEIINNDSNSNDEVNQNKDVKEEKVITEEEVKDSKNSDDNISNNN